MRLELRARIYVGFVIFLCCCSLVYVAVTFRIPEVGQLALFAVFTVLSILSEVYATRIPAYKWEISSSIAIYLAALFILGPSLSVVLLVVATLVSELLLRGDKLKEGWASFAAPVAFNVSQLVVTVTITGLVLRFSEREALLLQQSNEYLLAVAAFAAYSFLNWSLVTGIISITERKWFLHSLWVSIRGFFVQYLVLCVSALLLTVLYSISIWHVFLAIFPLTLVHVSFRSYLKLQTEARKTFERISRILDERDHYTAIHSSEVAKLAVQISEEMDLSQTKIERIDIAARVHDIGKVAVPDAILLKPGPLTDEEWEIMKRHPLVSAELIEGLEIYAPVADAVRHEHERWDGSGYPDGLSQEQIPLIARVIAAADIYNALSTDRPYRKAFSIEETIRIIREMKGTDIDPTVANALLRVIEGFQEV